MSAAAGSTTFFNSKFQTSFGNDSNLKNYLIGQTAFSTLFGYFVCRLPFFHSAALGVATEVCRYATDKAVAHLSTKSPFIRDHQTATKTALLAGSFFLTHWTVNALLPSSGFIAAGLVMTATYLVAEPIVKRIVEKCTTNKLVNDILTDIYGKYGSTIATVNEKIHTIWNSFGGNA